jgi:hypothetical protein
MQELQLIPPVKEGKIMSRNVDETTEPLAKRASANTPGFSCATLTGDF